MLVQPRDNIVLIGFLGCGKTTVGKALARKLQLQFLRTDGRVAARARMEIREIIKQFGEPAFRTRETHELKMLQRSSNKQVIEAGAGVVTHEGNHELLRSLGWVIHLHAEPEELFRRYSEDPNRPMLKAADAQARFSKLLAEREPLYAKAAHASVETTNASVDEVVNRLRAVARSIAAQSAPVRTQGAQGPKPGDVVDVLKNIFDLFT